MKKESMPCMSRPLKSNEELVERGTNLQNRLKPTSMRLGLGPPHGVKTPAESHGPRHVAHAVTRFFLTCLHQRRRTESLRKVYLSSEHEQSIYTRMLLHCQPPITCALGFALFAIVIYFLKIVYGCAFKPTTHGTCDTRLAG
mmetsp:Transcript_124116/g.396921  ORF Transcript_124116/g.396921 Transcript_124116/m.396921 type:complete len:142 (+) Transcript_124116:559-984(+)